MELSYRQTQLPEVAKKLLHSLPSKVLAFYGPMGVGKTTLIKALLRALGALDAGSSPTFGIVNEYHDQQGDVLAYHFDFYRIETETEALDLGFEDYLNQDAWIFMEWPENIPGLIPGNTQEIRLKIVDKHTRKLTFQPDSNASIP